MQEDTGRQAYTTSLQFLVENMQDAPLAVCSPAYRRLLESDVVRTYAMVGGTGRKHDFSFLCDVIAFNDSIGEAHIELPGMPQDKVRRKEYLRAIDLAIDRPQTHWSDYLRWENEFIGSLHRAHREVDTMAAQRVYAKLRAPESEEKFALDPLFLQAYLLLNHKLPAVRKPWHASKDTNEARAIITQTRNVMRRIDAVLEPYDGEICDTNRLDRDELREQLHASAMLILLKEDVVSADKRNDSSFLCERVERFAPRVNKLPDGLKPYYHILRRLVE